MDARLNMSGMTEHVRKYDEQITPGPLCQCGEWHGRNVRDEEGREKSQCPD